MPASLECAISWKDCDQGEPAGTAATPKATDQEWVRAVEQYLTQSARQDRFSGAVLLARGDTVLLEKAYGVADQAFKRPNRTDTRFNLGSINKIFTNIAIHQLASQGKRPACNRSVFCERSGRRFWSSSC
ncbi:MAG: serine hydrolase, partial [Acidobacteriota bacterium]